MKIASDPQMLNGFLGGLILGGSSSFLMYASGKITGMSGILGSSAIFRPGDDKRWTWSYLGGLIIGGVIMANIRPGSFSSSTNLSVGATVIAGLLCGFGTRLGSGCTSGHGICGIPRLSPRSLAAVGTFMGVAVVSSIICHSTPLKAVVEGSTVQNSALGEPALLVLPSLCAMWVLIALFSNNIWLGTLLKKPESHPADRDATWYDSIFGKVTITEHCVALAMGVVFAMGLGLSGMCDPAVVIAFLNFIDPEVGWNPTLAFVMAGGVAINICTFYWLSKQDYPPVLSTSQTKLSKIIKMKFHTDNLKIDSKLLLGSAMFGIGWGMGGICPGPGIVALGGHTLNSAIFLPALLAGMAVQEIIFGDSLLSMSQWSGQNSLHPASPTSIEAGAATSTRPATSSESDALVGGEAGAGAGIEKV